MLSVRSFAQIDSVGVNREKQNASATNEQNADRLKTKVFKNETIKTETQKSEIDRNQKRMTDAENLQQDNKMKAKEASRISRDASDAEKESKIAAKAEKRAQKARIEADKQAGKAAKATEKSNGN